KDGAAITSGSAASRTLANVQATDTGSYTVTVANSAGSVTSNTATLTVNNAPPVITAQPSSQSVTIGGVVSFTVGAAGSAPLSYQWFRGGTAITSATSSTLTFSSAQSGDAGSYSAIVTNTY